MGQLDVATKAAVGDHPQRSVSADLGGRVGEDSPVDEHAPIGDGTCLVTGSLAGEQIDERDKTGSPVVSVGP